MTSDFQNQTILLLCPRYFEYDQSISTALRQMGATVLSYDERPSNSTLMKAVVRLRLNFLVKPIIRRYYAKIAEEIKGLNVDHLFVVNPECVSVEILSKLKGSCSLEKTSIYMWDSFKNKESARTLVDHVDSFFTFDATDAASDSRLTYLPLFASPLSPKRSDPEPVDISFFGTLHSDRYQLCKKIEAQANEKGLRTYFFFYCQSKLLFHFRRIFDKNFRKIPESDVSFQPLLLSEIQDYMRASFAVFDIQHPKQAGLTMRTIEALSAECKLITTNIEVSKHDFFRSGNVLVVDRSNPELDADFFLSPYEKLPPEVIERFSVSNWLKEILKSNKR